MDSPLLKEPLCMESDTLLGMNSPIIPILL